LGDDSPHSLESLALRLMRFLVAAEQRSRLVTFETQVDDQQPTSPRKSRLLRICEKGMAVLPEDDRLELIRIIEKMQEAL
jgi:hypothetical protein